MSSDAHTQGKVRLKRRSLKPTIVYSLVIKHYARPCTPASYHYQGKICCKYTMTILPM
jgi:hypothetical protein